MSKIQQYKEILENHSASTIAFTSHISDSERFNMIQTIVDQADTIERLKEEIDYYVEVVKELNNE